MSGEPSRTTPVNTINPEALYADSELGEQLYYIRTTLEYLSNISAAIRKSGTKFRHLRADKLLKQREAKLEEFRKYLLHLVLIGPTKVHLLNWIHHRRSVERKQVWRKIEIIFSAKFNDTGRLSEVQRRIIQANLVRRNRFDVYKQRLRKKLKTEKNERSAHATTETRPSTQNNQPAPTPSQGSMPKIQTAPQQPATVERLITPSQSATSIPSDFKMPSSLRDREAKSAFTLVSQGVFKQDYPKCPVSEGNFLCPFCTQPLDSSYAVLNKKWRYISLYGKPGLTITNFQ